jgi:hypothetical protein
VKKSNASSGERAIEMDSVRENIVLRPLPAGGDRVRQGHVEIVIATFRPAVLPQVAGPPRVAYGRFLTLETASVFSTRLLAARLSAFAVRFSLRVLAGAVLPLSFRVDLSPMVMLLREPR